MRVPGSRQAALALGCLPKFVTLQCARVRPTIPPVKKPSETAVQAISHRCRRQVGTGLSPSGPHAVPPHPQPPTACPPAPWLVDALVAGKVLLRYRATTPAGACKPISCRMPGQVQCTMLEGREGLLAGGTLAFSGWPAASPRATQLLLGAGGAKGISLRVGFGSLGCVV